MVPGLRVLPSPVQASGGIFLERSGFRGGGSCNPYVSGYEAHGHYRSTDDRPHTRWRGHRVLPARPAQPHTLGERLIGLAVGFFRRFGFQDLGFQGFGFRVSCFWFWISDFVFRASGFVFRVSGLGSRVSGFGSRLSGFRFRVSGWKAPGLRNQSAPATRRCPPPVPAFGVQKLRFEI